MRRKEEKYIAKDKAVYNSKWDLDRDRRVDYKNLRSAPKIYALSMGTDEFLSNLLGRDELSELFERQQLLDSKFSFTVDMEVDEYTKVICEFRYFSNIDKYGNKLYSINNGKVDVFSGLRKVLSSNYTTTYVVYNGVVFELLFNLTLDIRKFNTDSIIVFNSIISTVEFKGDCKDIRYEIGGFYIENSTPQTLGLMHVLNYGPIFENKEIHVFQELVYAYKTMCCAFKNCKLHMALDIGNDYYRMLRRYGNICIPKGQSLNF